MRWTIIIISLIVFSSYATAFIVDPASTGFGGQTRTNNGVNATREWLFDNATKIITFGGMNYFVAPWFANADSTNFDNDLHAFQSGSWSKSNVTFPMVTDEFSRATYASVLYQSNDTIADAIINTIIYINDSGNTYTSGHTGSYGTEWSVRVNWTNGVWNIFKDQVSDTAADADAYLILTLLEINQSGKYNATNSNNAGTRAALICVQFVNNSYYDARSLNLKNKVNPGQTIGYFPCGGSNVCSGLGNGDLTYQAYDGPMLESLAGCHKLLGDNGAFNYTEIAEDQFQARLVAANWTGGSIPLGPGRAYKWTNVSSGQQPNAECTNSCTNSSGSTLGTEDPDSMRSMDICRAAWVWQNLTGWTLQNSSEACKKGASIKCLTNTTFGYKMSFDGTSYGSCTDGGFRAVGLGQSLFFMFNSTQMPSMLDQWNTHVQSRAGHINMDGQNSFGIYDKSFGLTDQAYAIGLADLIFNGSAASGGGGGGGCDVGSYRLNMTRLSCNATACFFDITCTDTSVRTTTTKQCTTSSCT